jgi:hypothetical protein
MARPVQLRNKLLWLIVSGLLGCDTGYRYNYAAYSPPVLLNSSEQQAMLQWNFIHAFPRHFRYRRNLQVSGGKRTWGVEKELSLQ